MNAVKVLVVEDNSLVAESIESILKQHNVIISGVFNSGEEAILKFQESKPDLILMDIKLAGKLDGIETAKEIHKKSNVPIIYLSDYTDKQTVDRAKPTFPVNYLSKPFNEDDLVRAVELAFNNVNAVQQNNSSPLLKGHVFIMDKQSFNKFALTDIICLKADRSYCEIITNTGSKKVSTSLNHIHEQIRDNSFIRVHRSWVVNINHLSRFEGNVLYLDKLEIPIGREHREELMGRLKLIR